MRPISTDLRARIMEALEEEPSSLIVAARFKVGASTVRKLRLEMERTGSIEPDPLPGRERLVKGKYEQRLRGLVRECPDATFNVLCELLADAADVQVSETTMWGQVLRMGNTQEGKEDPPRLSKEPPGRDRRSGELHSQDATKAA
jgi:transposase